MQDRDTIKKQNVVDFIRKNKDSSQARTQSLTSDKASPIHIQHGGTVFNIHPGATIGPITTTTIHLYSTPKKGSHGL